MSAFALGIAIDKDGHGHMNNQKPSLEKRAAEKPRQLPDINSSGRTALRQWRHDKGWHPTRAARELGVSVPTYYRYEDGYSFNILKANEIVKMTKGKVRYRDLIANFVPEYA